MNEADVGEVVRHLVNEEWSAKAPVNARAREVLVAKNLHSRRIQTRQRLWVVGTVAPFHLASKPSRERDDVGQLHRAFDERVAPENLLDQSRAGARQTDDKNCIRRGRAPGATCGKELACKKHATSVHMIRDLAGIVVERATAKTIAFAIVLKRLRIALVILERLSEREMQMPAILVVQFRAAKLRLHRDDVFGRKNERLQIGKTPPGFPEGRQKRDASFIGGDAILAPAECLQRVAVTHPRLRLSGVLFEQLLIVFDRFRVFANLAKRRRSQCTKSRIVRLLCEKVVRFGYRLDCFVLAVEHGRVVLARHAEIRGEFEAAREQAFRIFVAAKA